MAVDTDKSSLEADGKINSLDESTEFFDISSPDIQGLLANTRRLAGTPECQWLKTADPNKGEPGLRILSATAGAGGAAISGSVTLVSGTLTATGGNGGNGGDHSTGTAGAGGAAIGGDLTVNGGTMTTTNGSNGVVTSSPTAVNLGAGGKAVAGTVTDNRS